MFMTEDKYRSQPHCVALPVEARIGARGETGLPILAVAGSIAPKRTGFERKFTIGSGDAELAAHLTKEIHASRGAAADPNHTRTCGFARGSGPRCVLA